MEFLKKNWILVLIFVMVIYLFYNQYTSNARKKDVKPEDEKNHTPPPRFGTVNLNDIKPETTPKTKG